MATNSVKHSAKRPLPPPSEVRPKKRADNLNDFDTLPLSVFNETEYRQQIFSSIRMYNYLDNQRKQEGRPAVFMSRNIIYCKKFTDRFLNEYNIGEELPFLWSGRRSYKRVNLTKKVKENRLLSCIDALKNRKELDKKVSTQHNSGGYQFSIGSLALIEKLGENGFWSSEQFRLRVANLGYSDCIERVPTYYIDQSIEETDAEHKAALKKHADSLAAFEAARERQNNERKPKTYHSLIFRNCRFQLIHGKRRAKVRVFLGKEVKYGDYDLELVKGAVFAMTFPKEHNIIIDIPQTYAEKYVRVHIILEVNITPPLDNNETGSGKVLRSRRTSAKPPEPFNRATFDPREEVFEQTYFSAREIFTQEGKFKEGNYNMTLVEYEHCKYLNGETKFLPQLYTEMRRRHYNPFIRLSLEKHTLSADNVFSDMKLKEGSVIGCGKPYCIKLLQVKPCVCKKRPEALTPPEDVPPPAEVLIEKDYILPTPKKRDNHEDSRRGFLVRTKKGNQIVPSRIVNDAFPFFLNIEDYFGRYLNENGRYVNPCRVLEECFQFDVLNNKKTRDTTISMFPMKCPQKLIYRFIGINPDEHTTLSAEQQHSLRQPAKVNLDDLHRVINPNWVSLAQTEDADCCIICKRRFPHLFALMMHYNHSYPRLAFTFGMPKDLRTANQVRIDVSLNPFFHDFLEFRIPFRSTEQDPFSIPSFLVSPFHTIQLKCNMRLDLTLFISPLKSLDMVHEQRSIFTRYVHPATGQPVRLLADDTIHPNQTPQPAYNTTVRYINENILDFTDVDGFSKEYMCYWNQYILSFPRRLLRTAGYYMLQRLFIYIFGDLINKHHLQEQFLCHLTLSVDKGLLSGAAQYDLIKRLIDKNYEPLEDPRSSLTSRLMNFAIRMHKRYVESETGRKPATKLRLEYNPFYRSDPCKLSYHNRMKLFKFLLCKTKAIRPGDAVMLFLQSPFSTFLNQQPEAEFFRHYQPVDWTAIPTAQEPYKDKPILPFIVKKEAVKEEDCGSCFVYENEAYFWKKMVERRKIYKVSATIKSEPCSTEIKPTKRIIKKEAVSPIKKKSKHIQNKKIIKEVKTRTSLDSKSGIKESKAGIKESKPGVKESKPGIKESKLGVSEQKPGIKEPKPGMREPSPRKRKTQRSSLDMKEPKTEIGSEPEIGLKNEIVSKPDTGSESELASKLETAPELDMESKPEIGSFTEGKKVKTGCHASKCKKKHMVRKEKKKRSVMPRIIKKRTKSSMATKAVPIKKRRAAIKKSAASPKKKRPTRKSKRSAKKKVGKKSAHQ